MLFVFFFFFKQKTAYEMRISDWSSDVCCSDLISRCRVPVALMALPLALSQLGVAPIMCPAPRDRDAEEQDHKQQRDDYDYPDDHGCDYNLTGSRIET